MLRLTPTGSCLQERLVVFVPRWLPAAEPVGLPYRVVPGLSALLRNGVAVDLVIEPHDGRFSDAVRRLLDGAAAVVAFCAELNPAEQLPGITAFLGAVAAAAPELPRWIVGGFVPLLPRGFDFEGLATPLCSEESGAVLQALARLRGHTLEQRQAFGVEALQAMDLARFTRPEPLLFGNCEPTLQLPTGLGCGKRCPFCFYERTHLRLLPAPAVVAAVAHCVERHRIRQFQFGELDFLAAPVRALAIADGLCQRGLDTRWFALASVADLLRIDDDGLRRLARAGLVALEVGLEAGSDRALRQLDKRFTVDDALRTHARLLQQGIRPIYNLLLGWPGETEADRRATIRLAERIRRSAPHAVLHFRLYQAIPSTTFGDRALAAGPLLPMTLSALSAWRVDATRRLPWLPPREAERVVELTEHWLPLAYADELAGPGPSLRRRALATIARLRCRSGFLGVPLDRAVFEATEAAPRTTLLL
ncbi:MAG: radical SAM protein [Planctomycetes bacterium]|nr:radical SAM protein [Planctomycetota bacterium]